MCGYYILQRIKVLLDICFKIILITVILKVKNPQVLKLQHRVAGGEYILKYSGQNLLQVS